MAIAGSPGLVPGVVLMAEMFSWMVFMSASVVDPLPSGGLGASVGRELFAVDAREFRFLAILLRCQQALDTWRERQPDFS